MEVVEDLAVRRAHGDGGETLPDVPIVRLGQVEPVVQIRARPVDYVYVPEARPNNSLRDVS